MREPVLQGSASLELIAHGCRCCASPFWQQVRPSFQGGRGKRRVSFQHPQDPASNLLPDDRNINCLGRDGSRCCLCSWSLLCRHVTPLSKADLRPMKSSVRFATI